MEFCVRLVVTLFFLCPLALPAYADDLHQHRNNLHSLSPLKVYFDVNVGVGKKLETRLMLIRKTYGELVEQGGRPEFIIGFRGKASYFVTRSNSYVEPGDLAVKNKIHQWIMIFKELGIRMEQCQIAADFTGIEAKDFLPEVEVVSNGYVSMIAYHNQGFAQIPMD